MNPEQAFIRKFSAYLRGNCGINKGDTVLLAASGGLDSMALCYLFTAIDQPFAIAHCNFQLRGAESDEDEAFLRATAQELNCELYVKRFDTIDYKNSHLVSTQMAARELRYAWFDELCENFGYKYLATAHHLDDHLETILANIAKGTGLAGLHGIRPVNGHIVRPLMAFTRTEIAKFARSLKIIWREDSSNETDDYTRNFIRHQVVPLLQQINPSIVQTMWRNSMQWQQAEQLVAEQVDEWKSKIWSERGTTITISLDKLQHHPSSALILYGMVKHLGFNFLTCVDILQTRVNPSGKVFHGDRHTMVIDRGRLLLTPSQSEPPTDFLTILEPNDSSLEVNNRSWQMKIINHNDWTLTKDSSLLQVDIDKVQWPIVIRPWQEGDVIAPLGMRGKKKVSDLMIDAKIPVNLKRTQHVVCDSRGLIWVVGLRIAERVKITNQTKRVLILIANNSDHESI